MIHKIKESVRASFQMQQKMYDAEISEREAVLYALQTQINPHFMYNTLDCIRSIARVKGVPEIETISIGMSKFLRYSLNPAIETTLEQEIEIFKEYVNLMKIRRQQKIILEIEVPVQMRQNKILRLLLLTVVENTFKHGFTVKRDSYIIRLKASEHNKHICISIFDNGKGILPEICEKIQRELSNEEVYLTDRNIGLLNSNKRIKLNYGNEFGLSIKSEYGKYTQVDFILPNKK